MWHETHQFVGLTGMDQPGQTARIERAAHQTGDQRKSQRVDPLHPACGTKRHQANAVDYRPEAPRIGLLAGRNNDTVLLVF